MLRMSMTMIGVGLQDKGTKPADPGVPGQTKQPLKSAKR